MIFHENVGFTSAAAVIPGDGPDSPATLWNPKKNIEFALVFQCFSWKTNEKQQFFAKNAKNPKKI